MRNIFRSIFGPAGRDKFSDLMIRELRVRGVGGSIQYDREAFLLAIAEDGGGRSKLYLSNAYRDYCATPWRRRHEAIQAYAATHLCAAQKEQMSHDASNLLPRVRERFYFESFKLLSQIDDLSAKTGPAGKPSSPEELPTRSLTEDLSMHLVYDFPQAISTVAPSTLRELGLSFDEAVAKARDNLWRRSNEDFIAIGPATYRSPWQDTHDASRLYLHDLIWQLKVKGRHVVMAPNRNVLLVTGSEDDDGLTMVAALADEVLEQPRPMTGIPIVLDGARWASFCPEPQSRAYQAIRRSIARSRAMFYSEQRELLDKLHEKTNQDVFVAGHNLMQRQDGSFYNWTSWVDGVTDALMPRADFIFFSRVSDDAQRTTLGFAKWENVFEVAAGLMEQTVLYPTRFRVTQFPSDSQLAQIKLRPAAW